MSRAISTEVVEMLRLRRSRDVKLKFIVPDASGFPTFADGQLRENWTTECTYSSRKCPRINHWEDTVSL